MNFSKILLCLPKNNILNPNVNIFRVCSGLSTVQIPSEVSANVPVQESELDKLYKTVELELKGNDPAVLKSYCKFATLAGKHFEIESKTWDLRKPKHERFTVYKSVHIYKKHKAQYELRTYFSFVQFKHLTGSTCDTLMEYLQRNLPEGVALKTSKIELQKLPDYLKQ